MRRHPLLILSLVALLAVIGLGSFPVRAYVSQTHQREALEAEAARLAAGNEQLLAQVVRLQTDEVVEQLARERYHLVKPGEEAYFILPDSQPASAEPPAAAAAAAVAGSERPNQKAGLFGRAWARIVSIF